MKLTDIIVESTNGDGDCFEVAGRAMMGNSDPNLRLVHAFVTGQGRIRGRRFEHAWNEIGDQVIDNSNGRKITLPKLVYYAIGHVNTSNPDEYRVYDKKATLAHMVRNKHWGPWELKDSPGPLNEVGDDHSPTYKLSPEKITSLPKTTRYSYNFDDDEGRSYNIIATVYKSDVGKVESDSLQIDFALVNSVDYGDAFSYAPVKKHKNPIKVYNTIKYAIKQTMLKTHPNTILFMGSRRYPEMLAVYNRIAKNFGRWFPEFEYDSIASNIMGDESYDHFIFRKKKK